MPRPERALDDEDATLARFALGLRALRDNAGRPSYRTLAETTDYSVTTLSEAAGGRYLPTLAVTLAYVRACSGDVGEWEKTWHGVASELAAAAAPESPAEPDGEASPYIGLATFEASDAHRFFGREKVVADLADRVGGQRFVAVFGASGAGKSSILRAGLVAAWTARGKPATLLTPGARPEQAYDAALATLGTGDTDRLLVVDQFEEIFTLCQDEAERERFLARLLPDARVETGGPRVVIGVRTDFYGHCADHAALAEALQDSQFLVGPMTPDELRAAIIQPAVQAGGNIETPLLAAVIADCAGQPGVLPLLSHALRETWQRRSGTRMTLSGYQAAGGITHAIARTAEHTYDALDARGRQLAKSLFLRLTAPGEGTGDTKRRVDMEEVDTTDPNLVAVLARLTDARLVTVDGSHLEITHEALIRCWPRLSEWLAGDKQCLRTHRQLTDAAAQWNLLHRDRGALYRGVRLSHAHRLAGGPIELSAIERDFLTASTNEENRLAAVSRKRTSRLRMMICLLSVLLVAAGTLSVVAIRAQNAAQAAQQAATGQRDAALAQLMLGEATGLSASDPSTAGQLSLAAYRISPSAQARSMVLRSADALRSFTAPIPGGILIGLSPNGTLAATNDITDIGLYSLDSATHTVREAGTIPLGLPGPGSPNPEGATFSPSGRLMVADYTDGPPKLYDTSDPAHPTLLTVLPDTGGVARFDSDRYVITESHSETEWDLIDPRHPKAISTFDPPPSLRDQTLTFVGSEDGRVAAQVSYGPSGDTVEVLDTSTPGPATPTWSITVPGQAGDPIALSHGILAVATAPGTIYLWQVSNPHDVIGLGTLQVQTQGFQSVAISADGTEVAAGVNHAVDTWDLTAADRPRLTSSIAVDSGIFAITDLGFQNDRTIVAQIGNGGSNDTQALWVDLPQPALSATNGAQARASFSPDGSLLSINFSSTLTGAGTQLWDVRQPSAAVSRTTLRGATGVGAATVFAPRGHLLATGDSSHGRLWDVTDPGRPVMLAVLPISPVEFSPDGRTLLGSNGTLWDVSDPRHPRQVPGLPQRFYDNAAFSPDGALLVVADNSKITLYRISGSSGPKVAGTIDYPGTMVAFAATGRTLAAASYGGRFGFWNLDDPAKPVLLATLEGAKGGNVPPVFSANGQYVAIPRSDGSTQVWDVRNPAHPALFATLDDATPVQFDPNGKVIAVYTGDGDLQLRQIDVTAAITRLCANTPTINENTWRQYASPLPYQPPCDPRN